MKKLFTTGILVCIQATAHAADIGDGAGNVPASGWAVYTDIDFWRAYDAFPVSQFDRDWSGYSPRQGRNTFFQRDHAIIGVARNGWRIGWEFRQDAVLHADRATLDAVHLYRNRAHPDQPASFAVQADYAAMQSAGLRVGRAFAGPTLAGRPVRIDISGAVYTGQKYRAVGASGLVTYAPANTYGFDVAHHDANTQATFPFMDMDRGGIHAKGASLSIGAAVPLAARWTVQIQADDLLSHMRWKGLPVTDESIGSNVTSYDDNGYLNYRPLLSGRNRQVDRTVSIPRRTEATLAYDDGQWELAAQLTHYAGINIPTLSVAHHFAALTLRANVETRFDTVGIGLDSGFFHVLVQADRLNLGKSKAQRTYLYYALPF